MKVLCIGEALIDMICTDVNVSLSNGQHFLKKAGGAPANVAAAIAALGGEVSMAAKVGDDPFGQHLIELLNTMGVNTSLIIKDPHHFTTFAFVSLMNDGERDFYFNRGADKELTIADLTTVHLNEYGIVHFGSATAFLPGPLQSTYIELLAKAKQAGCLISFDPNYRHLLFQNNSTYFISQCALFIESCDFFKLSDEEAFLITGCDTVALAANALRKKTKAVFTITLGKEGTMLCIGGQIEIIESISVQAVDATGAGDAFVGAVLYQLNKRNIKDINLVSMEDWKTIIRNANKAGARTCEYMGAMEAFKHLNNSIFD
jgi:fructokinase